MSKDLIEEIEFAHTRISLIRERQVQKHLSLGDAIGDLRDAFRSHARQQAANCVRVRLEPKGSAWLHTLRANIATMNVAGGKDYTSIKSTTPSMWATVIDMRTGLPLALIEAEYLSRIRTAATTAIATDLLAPTGVTCLAHFGVGKISELLVRAILKVRPSVTSVFVVRGDDSKGTPDWCRQLEGDVRIELCDRAVALNKADLVTTATNSKTPVIPPNAAMPLVRHLNLVGSNHIRRQEISAELAYRCLPPNGYLVVEDTEQARLEAGDFVAFGPEFLNWDRIPTLGHLLDCDVEKWKARNAKLTAFKSVGIGLMDLAVAAGVLRRMGLLTNPPPVLENAAPMVGD